MISSTWAVHGIVVSCQVQMYLICTAWKPDAPPQMIYAKSVYTEAGAHNLTCFSTLVHRIFTEMTISP
jgi:hypothetical protein